ncbi:MAG: hypothetical protein ACEPOW_12270 [Bacteroidales bacterium]
MRISTVTIIFLFTFFLLPFNKTFSKTSKKDKIILPKKKKTKHHRKRFNYPNALLFRYDAEESFGFMITGLSSCGENHYFCETEAYISFRLNNAFLTKSANFKTNNKFDFPDNQNIEKLTPTKEFKHGKMEVIFGFTNQFIGPSWLYMGAGASYENDYLNTSILYEDGKVEKKYILNKDLTKVRLSYECGIIIQIKKITIMGGALTHNFDSWYYQCGAGFAF